MLFTDTWISHSVVVMKLDLHASSMALRAQQYFILINSDSDMLKFQGLCFI